MNDERFNILISEARKVTLTEKEKGVLFQQLNDYLDYAPLPSFALPNVRGRFSRFLNSMFSKRLFPAIATLLIILAGSTSVAAENSLPGDLLYGVKVGVNERLSSTLSIGIKSKAQNKVAMVSTRLEEAEKLAVREKLTPRAQAQLETNFDKNINEVTKSIATLVTKGDFASAAEISSELESSLNSHYAVLVQLSGENVVTNENQAITMTMISNEDLARSLPKGAPSDEMPIKTAGTGGVKSEVTKLADSVKRNLAETTAMRKESQIKLSSEDFEKLKLSAETLFKSTENSIIAIDKYLNNGTTDLDEYIKISALIRLDLAKKYMALGKLNFEGRDFNEAFRLFTKASRLAKQAKLIADLESNGEINKDGLLKIEILGPEDFSLLNLNPDMVMNSETDSQALLKIEPQKIENTSTSSVNAELETKSLI